MKTTCLTLFFILCSVFTNAQVNPNDHWVDGYYQQNGTWVPGHYQTDPNGTINDNFSTYPNVNPYTGTQGTIQPQQGDGTYTSPDGTFKVATYGQPPVRIWSEQLRQRRAGRVRTNRNDQQRLRQIADEERRALERLLQNTR